MEEKNTQQSTQMNVNQILDQIKIFSTRERDGLSRKQRCEDLMRRKSATRWNEKKKLKMVRRLLNAQKQVDQSVQSIIHLREKLEELNTKNT